MRDVDLAGKCTKSEFIDSVDSEVIKNNIAFTVAPS